MVEEIRNNRKETGIDEAVDRAIEAMPKDFVIKAFLDAHKAEVKGMLLTEYDEAKTMQMLKKEAQEGLLIELVQSGDLSMEKAAQKLGITVNDFEKLLQEKQ